jgi:NADPH:quinone reductase-like Zn-dependent oxidoreductase
MRAITVSERDAGVAGLSLTELPYPEATDNDVIVRVHAAGFTPGELDWPHTWTDRGGRDRTPSVPGHELSGVVVELGYGTTLLSVGQRVFGLADWARNGSLAEYTAVEARNLAPLPMDIDHAVAAALPISGLAAWQGLFDHGRLTTGQTVLIHGAAGGVGSIAVQLAREVGARVIGTGRTADRDRALELGAHTFLDLDTEKLEDAGEVDVVFDVIGGEVLADRPLWCGLAERSSPSPSRRRPSRATGGQFSSLSKSIAPSSPTLPREYGMDASSRSLAPYCRLLKLPPHSLPTSASLARRSCA